jgi:hypothetical protein
VSFNYLFKSRRRASRSDVTNKIEGVDIDSIGIAAGRRSASLMRSRRPCVLGCLRACLVSRTLAIPRWLRRVHAPGFSRCGGGSQDFFL